jgi:hypothetical protein
MKKINKIIIISTLLTLLLVSTSAFACSGGWGGRYRNWRWWHWRRCYFHHCEKPEPEPECTDADGDGYYAYDEVVCPEGNDCDDSDPEVNPGFSEDPLNENCSDGKDNDCDGLIDMDDPDCEGGVPD